MKTIALTGATGFVGRATLDRLLERGTSVRALTRRPQPTRQGVTWIEGSLDDEISLRALCTDAEAVVHIAGVVNARDAAGFDVGNRRGTLAMLHAAESAGVERFVHVSSLAAREPKLSVYGASKRAAEDAVVLSTRDWIVIRPPAVYGPGDTELLDMFRMAKRGLAVLPPKGCASFIHVDDLARLIVAAIEAPASHVVWEADDGRAGGWSHVEFAAALGVAVGRGVFALSVPKTGLKAAAMVDRAVRGDKAKLTYDRAGYLSHADWTIDPGKRPPADVWTPRVATAEGLTATASAYRVEGLL